ncbi:MAG: hypothetical protein KF868_16120 [Acidobacteria bacterium]|nr:hypothetical protein [Acidobacteriota bacterium]MCW5970121.1 hypothetical protein [Blastocatellales bacterium]
MRLICADCGGEPAHLYEERAFDGTGEPARVLRSKLCAACARARRRDHQQTGEDLHQPGATREELMFQLEEFFSLSGALEICARCHAQGTGCCPAPCRSLSVDGCLRKTLWCSAFVCSALINAVSELDPEAGRELRWLRREVAPAEYRVFEFVSRAPADMREDIRPLRLPPRYPQPLHIVNGARFRPGLSALAEEVLEVRRAWRSIEETEDNQTVTRSPQYRHFGQK